MVTEDRALLDSSCNDERHAPVEHHVSFGMVFFFISWPSQFCVNVWF